MFGGIKFYDIYIREYTDDSQEVVLVKQGFSFLAFILHVFWALFHRIWPLVLVFLGWSVVMGAMIGDGILSREVSGIMTLGLQLFTGFYAGAMRGWTLTQKHYVFSGAIAATSEEAALQRFLDHERLREEQDPLPATTDNGLVATTVMA